MKLTDEQKAGVRRAVLKNIVDMTKDEWGEPFKDVDQYPGWPHGDDESEAAFDYLDSAIRAVVAKVRALTP